MSCYCDVSRGLGEKQFSRYSHVSRGVSRRKKGYTSAARRAYQWCAMHHSSHFEAKDFANKTMVCRPYASYRSKFVVRLQLLLREARASTGRKSCDKERLPFRFVFERVFRFKILPVSGFTLVKAQKEQNRACECRIRAARNGADVTGRFEKSIITPTLSEYRYCELLQLSPVNDVTAINE